MSPPSYQIFEEEIAGLKKAGRYRELRTITGPVDTTVFMDGREMILLCSNNYLGLATHPHLKEAEASALKKYGTGACASRLISGNMEIHETLEEKIATFKGCQSAIIFATGYMANVGLITALAGKGDLILSDELNHASIIDGCRLSCATISIYAHRDVDAIKWILSQHGPPGPHNRRLIITEGIFSMDGDIAPLPDILEVAKMYDAWVIVDDAHATGVLGENGRGTAEHFRLKDDQLIQVGTFSKSLASLGGYVAGPEPVIEWLRNNSRSFIYSTALPPSICAGSIAAIEILESNHLIRRRLWKNIKRFRQGLINLGFDTMGGQAQIIPILTGDTNLTMEFAEALFEKGIYAPGIRPPTVPEGKSRIRVSLMASHTYEQIDRVLSVFQKVGRQLGII
ncbi:MAG: 8-amino-7-oxononanoate synthase [Deltaproteobacteria bacterium]|nr:8-amino-7-oxononanoate synthase [Deltaproteobacteria bacterium]